MLQRTFVSDIFWDKSLIQFLFAPHTPIVPMSIPSTLRPERFHPLA
jgi:hypothetical protein